MNESQLKQIRLRCFKRFIESFLGGLQVHLAKLKGETVVVKVQRPGLKELFDIDLKNLRVLANQLQKIDPKTDGAARDWVAIYDEYVTQRHCFGTLFTCLV